MHVYQTRFGTRAFVLPDGVSCFHWPDEGFYFYHNLYERGRRPFLFVTEAHWEVNKLVQEALDRLMKE